MSQKGNSTGSSCSKSGKNYELAVYNIVKNCIIDDKRKKRFNIQTEKDLGGCSSGNDLICNYKKDNDIAIEIKKEKTPDWMQCSLTYDKEKKRWMGSPRCKIPEKSKELFEEILNKINLFNGNIPPFMIDNITYDEWTKIKKNTKDFNDVYIECPNDTIKNKLAILR